MEDKFTSIHFKWKIIFIKSLRSQKVRKVSQKYPKKKYPKSMNYILQVFCMNYKRRTEFGFHLSSNPFFVVCCLGLRVKNLSPEL